MTFLQDVSFHTKVILATITGVSAMLADAANEAKGWEDLGLKTALTLALIFVVKLLLDQQKLHKQELKEIWDAHKAEMKAMRAEHKEEAAKREDRMVKAIEVQVISMNEVRDLTRDQTEYFKTVTRNIVYEKIHGKKPDLP